MRPPSYSPAPLLWAGSSAVCNRGEEPYKLRGFINALGLSDEDAAQVHIEAGRRIMRMRFEAGSRASETEERRAFQKLIYTSTLVFGDQKVGSSPHPIQGSCPDILMLSRPVMALLSFSRLPFVWQRERILIF